MGTNSQRQAERAKAARAGEERKSGGWAAASRSTACVAGHGQRAGGRWRRAAAWGPLLLGEGTWHRRAARLFPGRGGGLCLGSRYGAENASGPLQLLIFVINL